MIEDESFGRMLRRRRKGCDLTQEALAQQVYCAADTIKKVEQGRRRPSRQLAMQLADCLGLAGDERAAFLQRARAELRVDGLPPPTADLADRTTSHATARAPDNGDTPCADERPPLASANVLPASTVTFLFTDIEGSTALWEQHPSVMPAALARHDAILCRAIEQHSGHLFKTVGDAVYAAFSSAPAALAAALDAQIVLQAADWGALAALRVRMAVHTGVVAAHAGDYLGPALNRVSRLLAAGHRGQILLSRATMELVRDALPPNVTLRDLGQRRLKDLSRPEHVFQVVVPDLPADFPPLRTLDARPNNLPAPPNALIGREQEVAAVRDLLRRTGVRLVTLTGPGGVGKTRLVLQVASELLDDLTHGVWFVNLAPIGDPALVIPIIAQTLGLKESGSQSFMDGLKAYLREKQLLLLLDNFEQVVDAAVDVAELLVAAPDLKLLITSRAVLHLSGEHEFTVPPLALPERQSITNLARLTQYEAVRLFIERAQAVKPDFMVTNTNAPAVAEICDRLDGLPLAIELAAVRIKLFSPEALLARLSSRLTVLIGGPRDVPARQQTLRNTIAWSYQLLDAAEQTLFARLGVFVGGCTLEAAEAVLGDDGQSDAEVAAFIAQDAVLDGLASLVDKSLLKQVEQADSKSAL